MELQPLSERIGALVTGIDLTEPISDDQRVPGSSPNDDWVGHTSDWERARSWTISACLLLLTCSMR